MIVVRSECVIAVLVIGLSPPAAKSQIEEDLSNFNCGNGGWACVEQGALACGR